MNVLVIAPHPDDETLGCGGALFRHAAEGDALNWMIVTGIDVSYGWPTELVQKREDEIQMVAKEYGFSSVYRLGFPTTRLDSLPLGDLIGKFAEVCMDVKPEVVYMPFQ